MDNYELQDILARISEIINKPELSAARDLVVDVMSVCNPVAGIAAGAINKLISDYDAYKLTLLLKGLSTNLNMEKRINELYNYVNKSDENAINVANILKKTINAESPKTCLIYGLVIADHLDSNHSFSQEELIVCKALENCTDYDLSSFKEIIDQYGVKAEDGRTRIILPSSIANEDKYIITCDWCVYNRIFVMESIKVENSSLVYGRFYYTSGPANILLKYINDLHRVWEYQQ